MFDDHELAQPLRIEISEMPVNVVKTPEDEIAWERAKERAREQYPDATGDRFWKIAIASIRRVLVITMHAAKLAEEGLGTDQGAIAFRNSMTELGLLGFMVLVLALSMFFLDRTSPQEGLQREWMAC
jgi:hypothetical protein